jgi:hypothetical protein
VRLAVKQEPQRKYCKDASSNVLKKWNKMASSEREQVLTEVEMSAVFLVFNPLTY